MRATGYGPAALCHTSESAHAVAVWMKRSQRRRERKMQRINDPRLGVADPRYGVHRAHAGRQQAVVIVAVARSVPDFELGVKTGLAVDDDAPDAVGSAGSACRPVGGEVVGDAVDVLDRDDVDAVDDADATRPGGADGSRLDKPERGGDVARSGQKFARLANVVQSGPECLGDHGDGGAPAPAQDAGHPQPALVAERLAESE